MQWPLIEPKTDWTAPLVSSLPSWRGAKRVGFDLETRDPDLKKMGPGVRRRDGFVCGYSYALDGGPSVYVPLRHLGGGNVESAEKAIHFLVDQARAFTGTIVGANLGYDLDWSGSINVLFPKAKFWDVQLAAALINQLHHRFSLAHIAERLGLPGKDEAGLRLAAHRFGVNPKGEMWKLPGYHVGPYAEQDAALPLLIATKQKAAIEDNQLERIFDVESRLLPIVVKMRQRGVRVSEDRLDQLDAWALQQEKIACNVVKDRCSTDISGSLWKPNDLAEVLKMRGVIVPCNDEGKASVKKEWLEAQEAAGHTDVVVQAILRARAVNKMRTTFVNGLREHSVNGRVHCSFKQIANDEGGAKYGRMSCVQPNLQNQPAKDTEIGDMIRAAFLPDEGKLWCAADYSAQEPRMIMHFAERFGMQGGMAAAGKYRADPTTDSHRMMASLVFKCRQQDVTDKQRKMAKVIFLGLCFGMGPGLLCGKLGLPTQTVENGFVIAGAEGAKLLSRFHETVPFVRGLDKFLQKQAKSTGMIRTLLGRVCRFPRDEMGKFDWTRTALNRIVQGSAADQTKAAMVAAEDAGLELQLQIHDELDMSVVDMDEAKKLARIMETTTKLLLPSKVDVEIGDDWASASAREDDDAPLHGDDTEQDDDFFTPATQVSPQHEDLF